MEDSWRVEEEQTFEQLEESLLDIFRSISKDSTSQFDTNWSSDFGTSSMDDSMQYEEFLCNFDVQNDITIFFEGKSATAIGSKLVSGLNETIFGRPKHLEEGLIACKSEVQSITSDVTPELEIDKHMKSSKNDDAKIECMSDDRLNSDDNSLANFETNCNLYENSGTLSGDANIFYSAYQRHDSGKQNFNYDTNSEVVVDATLYPEDQKTQNHHQADQQEISNASLYQSSNGNNDVNDKENNSLGNKVTNEGQLALYNDEVHIEDDVSLQTAYETCFQSFDEFKSQSKDISELKAHSQREDESSGSQTENVTEAQNRDESIICIKDSTDNDASPSKVCASSESPKHVFSQRGTSASTIGQIQSCDNDESDRKIGTRIRKETKLKVLTSEREESDSSADGEIRINLKDDNSNCDMTRKEVEKTEKAESSNELLSQMNSMEKHCKTDEDMVFVSDDPIENNDINDPGWNALRQLTTEEECYKAVKDLWESDLVPNPHRDLTHHTYRLRRVGKSKATICISRKRPAISSPNDTMPSTKHHKRTASCTKVLDEEIKCIREKYTSHQEKQNHIYKHNVQTIESQLRTSNIYLIQRFKEEERQINNCCISKAEQQFHLFKLNEWVQHERARIFNAAEDEEQQERIIYRHYKNWTDNTFQSALDKLEKAKNEVLKFNQFYSGLHKTNPTIIEGQMLLEAEKTMEMYRAYQRYYHMP